MPRRVGARRVWVLGTVVGGPVEARCVIPTVCLDRASYSPGGAFLASSSDQSSQAALVLSLDSSPPPWDLGSIAMGFGPTLELGVHWWSTRMGAAARPSLGNRGTGGLDGTPTDSRCDRSGGRDASARWRRAIPKLGLGVVGDEGCRALRVGGCSGLASVSECVVRLEVAAE